MSEIIKTDTLPADQYDLLLQSIDQALRYGRDQVAYAVSRTILETYWKIGQSIVEHEQKGLEKAEYGSDVLNRLSADLSVRYGKGFSRGNVFYMRKLYLTYQKVQTLSELLSWSHYVELLKIDDPLERSFYENECTSGGNEHTRRHGAYRYYFGQLS